jgi:peroxiredoxin
MRLYKVPGTPSGYRLDAKGRVASELLVGADALLEATSSDANGQDSLTAEVLKQKEEAAIERARQAGLGVRESLLNRNGLDPGVTAPEFVLPDLDGNHRSLSSLLDKRVMLVFSDPECGPCQALAPELVQLHHQYVNDGLRVIMISRGDAEANRAKARQHNFPFPVLLQNRWEVSKDYAMFATPIAYLINRNGTIAKPVAVGRNAILELVAG